MTSEITLDESKRLIALERQIAGGLRTFVQVGEALCEIRDSRLYRVEFGTFEEYCKSKWGFTKTQAFRLIGGAEVAKNLSPIGDKTKVVPVKESQARPLTSLPPEQQSEAWEKAVDDAGGEQPTAKQVENAVKQVIGNVPQEPVVPKSVAQDLVNEAINILEKISDSDPERETALERLSRWIDSAVS